MTVRELLNPLLRDSATDSEISERRIRSSTKRFNAGQFIKGHKEEKEGLSDDYRQLKLLGRGSFGEVYLYYHKPTKTNRAVKIIKKQPNMFDATTGDDGSDDEVVKEFEIIKNLDHPNILKVFELFQDDNNYYFVTDVYQGGELMDRLVENGPLTESEAALLLSNLLTCVNYCHERNLVHRDLKLENILLDDNMKMDDIKIIDFGLAHTFTTAACSSSMEQDQYIVGTPMYMAPETIEGKFSPKSDVWSCGIIAFMVLGDYAPFQGTEDEIMDLVYHGEIDFEQAIWDELSEKAVDFCHFLLEADPLKRPTARQALDHPWLQEHREQYLQNFRSTSSDLARNALSNLQTFTAHSKLKQAVCACIASQLLTKQEKEDVDRVFRALDKQCNGKIDAQDLDEAFRDYLNVELSEDDLQELMSRVDVQGSGAIEYWEFIIAAKDEETLFEEERLKRAFHMFDPDNHGYITAESIRVALSMKADQIYYIVNKILFQVDLNGDGQVSFEEFKSMMISPSKTDPIVRRLPCQREISGQRRKFRHSRHSRHSSSSRRSTRSPIRRFAKRRITTRHFIQSKVGGFYDEYELGPIIQGVDENDDGCEGKDNVDVEVFLCYHRPSGGTERFVKRIQKSSVAEKNASVLAEFNIIKTLDHPNILKLYGLYQDAHYFYLVTDVYRGAKLIDYVLSRGRLKESEVALLMVQLLGCLNYCHKNRIVHRDLKLERVVLDDQRELEEIKLFHFGFARMFATTSTSTGESEREGSQEDFIVGTPMYMAPEVLEGYFSPKSDVWACGIIAFMMLGGYAPFHDDEGSIFDQITNGSICFDEDEETSAIWASIPKRAKDFITFLLQKDPSERPTAEQALDHPWLGIQRFRMTNDFKRLHEPLARRSLCNMTKFHAQSKLKQAVCAYIASQLLSRSEKEEINRVFQALDTSCDGQLHVRELREAFCTFLQHELTDEEFDEIFSRVDLDDNGQIEYWEFLIASMSEIKLFDGKRLRLAFELFDTDGNGYISVEDMVTMLEMEDDTDNFILQMIQEADQDGDGRIWFDEFQDTMLETAA